MISKSLDVYATTNPVFVAFILRSFSAGYTSINQGGIEFPLIFLVLPMVMSRRIADTLTHTNQNTGFLNWLSRHPEVLVDLPNQIRNTKQYTKDALLFGTYQGLLKMQMQDELRIWPDSAGLLHEPRWPASDERGRALRHAQRLGIWIGGVQSVETVLISLGVSP